MSKTRRLPGQPISSSSQSHENTTKSDGSHLLPGSSEYRERVLDLKGVDEFEQERVKLDAAGLRRSAEIKETDAWHENEAKEAENWIADKQNLRLDSDGRRLRTAERSSQYQIRKMAERNKIVSDAQKAAAVTDSTEDDKKVKRRLPKELNESVYNNSELDLEGPGSKVFKKYID